MKKFTKCIQAIMFLNKLSNNNLTTNECKRWLIEHGIVYNENGKCVLYKEVSEYELKKLWEDVKIIFNFEKQLENLIDEECEDLFTEYSLKD